METIRAQGPRLRTHLSGRQNLRCSVYFLLQILDREVCIVKVDVDRRYTLRMANADGCHCGSRFANQLSPDEPASPKLPLLESIS